MYFITLYKFFKKIEQWQNHFKGHYILLTKHLPWRRFSEVPLWLLKSSWSILQHCKYEISKILYPQIKEQSLLFLRIYIYENCICVFILFSLKISTPTADLLNISMWFDRSGLFPKRFHSPARRKDTADVFLSVIIMHINIMHLNTF